MAKEGHEASAGLRRGRGWLWVTAIVAILAYLAADSGPDGEPDASEPPPPEADSLASMNEPARLRARALGVRLAPRGERAFAQAAVPYRVHQAEFQHYDGELTWVFQIDDPADAAARAGAGSDDMIVVTVDAPLSAYATAVRPHWDTLTELDVDHYILSFADADRTVYEIPAVVMEGLVVGRHNPREAINHVLVTGLSE